MENRDNIRIKVAVNRESGRALTFVANGHLPMIRKLLFLIITNFLLCFPVWYAFRHIAPIHPFGGIRNVEVEGWLSVIFLNHDYHPFRLIGEWTFLLSLYFLVRPRGMFERVGSWAMGVLWLTMLVFQIWVGLMQDLYGCRPQWANEWALVREVVPVFLAGMDLSFLGVITACLIFILLVVWLCTRILIRLNRIVLEPSFRAPWKTFLVLLILYLGVSGWRYYKADPYDFRLNVQWLVPRIAHSLRSSEIHHLNQLDYRSLPYEAYHTLEWTNPPNIYLLFLESYGAVTHLSPFIRDTMANLFSDMDARLRQRGWDTYSAWSLAPIKGGRSWLSFTSAITGVLVDNQPAYNELLGVGFRYPHLVRLLNAKGYATHRINTMQTNAETDRHIPYERIRDFHEFTTWTLFPDIPYQGLAFQPFGGIPDQYALEFVHEKYIQDKPGPHFLFFITLAGHLPWYPPPPLLPDYKALDTTTVTSTGDYWSLSAGDMDRYQDAMIYQLEMVEHFVTRKGGSNDLFIIIGDHQPPGMEWQISGMVNDDHAVPVHFICNDPNAEKILHHLSFATGWRPPDPEQAVRLRHEGLYSLLIHYIQAIYGTGHQEVPVWWEGR